tara:strand:- start:242 stop:355 length:114 start_codon:yes stop_codon:yes gene_type:complete
VFIGHTAKTIGIILRGYHTKNAGAKPVPMTNQLNLIL